MDKTLLLQLIKKDLEDIQILFQHFEHHPLDMTKGMELAASKMENLNREFQMLQQNLGSPIEQPTNNSNSEFQETILTPVIEPQLPPTEKQVENISTNEPEIIKIPEIKPSVPKEELTTSIKESEIHDILGEKLSSKGITDIRNGIGINDKFLFIRELFNNQPEEYKQTIEYINQSPSLRDAMEWLNSKFQWDQENPFVLQFLEITKRKFN
ncbi:MAG: hypothetical protein ACEPOZ_00220 [Marinifilaceae bacterium]